jgi:glycerophosphoryl diester phosphodiesterase
MAHPPLLLGHRGARASTGVRENTFPSFDLALQHGCHGFEFDVRRTACGTAVICHDSKVGKLSVSRTQASKLQQLPRLDDLMLRYSEHAFLDIELKVKNLESPVLKALHEHSPKHGYVVSTFLPEVVMDLEARSASVVIGIICETPAQLALWPRLPADYVIPHRSLVNQTLIKEVQDAGLKIMVWTVNDAAAMLRFTDWGVDGIISDDTELLVRTLK